MATKIRTSARLLQPADSPEFKPQNRLDGLRNFSIPSRPSSLRLSDSSEFKMLSRAQKNPKTQSLVKQFSAAGITCATTCIPFARRVNRMNAPDFVPTGTRGVRLSAGAPRRSRLKETRRGLNRGGGGEGERTVRGMGSFVDAYRDFPFREHPPPRPLDSSRATERRSWM